MSENRNNNNQKEVQSYEEKIRGTMRDLATMKEGRRRTCNHKPNVNGRVIALHDSKINVPGKKDLPESTVICTRCESYFESSSYTADETDSGLYMFKSMAEQVKLNANLSDEDKEFLANYYAALDTVSQFSTYYLNMVEKLSNGDNNKRKGNRSSKGHMGINSSMFGGRGF